MLLSRSTVHDASGGVAPSATLSLVQVVFPSTSGYTGGPVTTTLEQAGDLILLIGAWFQTSPAPASPSGGGTWTSLLDLANSTTESELCAYWKASNGTSGSYSIALSPSDPFTGAAALSTAYVFRRSDGVTPQIAVGATYAAEANPIALSAFTAADNSGFLVVPVAAWNLVGSVPTGSGLTFVDDGPYPGVAEQARYHASFSSSSIPAITITGQDNPATSAVFVVTL